MLLIALKLAKPVNEVCFGMSRTRVKPRLLHHDTDKMINNILKLGIASAMFLLPVSTMFETWIDLYVMIGDQGSEVSSCKDAHRKAEAYIVHPTDLCTDAKIVKITIDKDCWCQKIDGERPNRS